MFVKFILIFYNPQLNMIVKIIGRHIIIYQDDCIKCLSNFLYFDRYHEFLHRILMPSKSPRSFLLDILKNPSKILLFEGSMKTNLQLLTLFINKKTQTRINTVMNTDQKTLCNVMNYMAREWRELLEFDPNTFKQLNLYFESQIEDKIIFDGTMLELFKVAVERSIPMVKRNKNIHELESSSISESHVLEENNCVKNEDNEIIQLIRAKTNEMEYYIEHKAKNGIEHYAVINDMKAEKVNINKTNHINKYIVRTVECLHGIFCENNERESGIDRLMTNYKKLIKDIRNKISLKNIYEEFPFHHEFKLINDYTIVKEYGGDFNLQLMDYNWVTENEKYIVSYVLTEIRKYNSSN